MLDRIQRGALGRKHRASLAAQAHEVCAGRHDVAFARQDLDFDIGIQRKKKASAIGRPATVTGSRLSMMPSNRASEGMTFRK